MWLLPALWQSLSSSFPFFLEFNWTLYRIFAYSAAAGQAKSMPGHISNCVKAKGKQTAKDVGTTNGNGHALLSGSSCSPSGALFMASHCHLPAVHSRQSTVAARIHIRIRTNAHLACRNRLEGVCPAMLSTCGG